MCFSIWITIFQIKANTGVVDDASKCDLALLRSSGEADDDAGKLYKHFYDHFLKCMSS